MQIGGGMFIGFSGRISRGPKQAKLRGRGGVRDTWRKAAQAN